MKPAGRELRLKNLFRIINGATPSPELANWNGQVAWATPVDIGRHNGQVMTSTERTITEEGLRSCAAEVAPRGSLALSTRAPIGYVAETAIEMSINQGCRLLIPRSGVESAFYRYVLSTYRPRLEALGRGSTFVELGTDDLADVVLPAPYVEEQRAIVRFLDEETAKIDAVLEKRRELLALVEEWEQAQSLSVLGDWRASFTRSLRQLGTTVLTGPFGTLLSAKEYVSGGIPIINPTHIANGVLIPEERISVPEVIAVRLARFRLRPGDIVMGRKGDVGRAALVPRESDGWICGSDSIAIRTRPDLLSAGYLEALLHVSLYRQQLAAKSTGATIANVNEKNLLSFRVPEIAPEAQRRAVDQVNVIRANAGGLRNKLTRQMQLLAAERATLITAAVTGRIDVGSAA